MTSPHNIKWLQDLFPFPSDQPIKLSQETMLKLLKEQQAFDHRVETLNNHVDKQIDIKVDKRMAKLGYADWAAYDFYDFDFDDDDEEDEDAKEKSKIRKIHKQVVCEMSNKAALRYSKDYIAIFMEELKTIISLAPKDEDGLLHTCVMSYGWYPRLADDFDYKDPGGETRICLEFHHGALMNQARIGSHDCVYYKGQPMGTGIWAVASIWRAMSEEEREVFPIKDYVVEVGASQVTKLWSILTEDERKHPKLLKFFINNLDRMKA
jgi:hypothetical protein